MLLKEMFEELALGELTDTSYSEDGAIPPTHQARIVLRLNSTIQHIARKYLLAVRDAVLDTSVKTTVYTLSLVQAPGLVRILDVTLPRVSSLSSEGLNQALQPELLNFEANTVRFLVPPQADRFDVIYQAVPARLATNPAASGFLDQNLNIPEELRDYVRIWTAADIFAGGNSEPQKKTGAELANKAEFLRNDLEMAGFLKTSLQFTRDLLAENGFK